MAVWPALSVVVLEVIAIVGATVSTAIAGESEPAVLSLPKESVNVAAATEIVPEPVKLAVGVNVAE